VLACERDAREVSRQSIVLVRPMRAGESVRRADITFKRPGTGIGPWSIDRIVGRVLARGLEADVPLAEADLS
jgi:sialic acid synthase SpsE